MIKIVGSKRYDSAKATPIAEKDHFTSSNNYSGTTKLMVTDKGNLFWWTESNGQDLYLSSDIWLPEAEIDLTGFELLNEGLILKFNLVEEA